MKLFTIIFIYFNYLLIKMSVYTISDLLETGIKSDFYDGYKKEISDLADKGWIKPGPRRELTDKAKDLMRKMIPEDRWGEPLQTFRLYRGFQPEDYELNAMLWCCALSFFYDSEEERKRFEARGKIEQLSPFEMALLGIKYGIERCLEAGHLEVVEGPSLEKQYFHAQGDVFGDISK